ncbi:hypothetical protein Q3V94_02595 [Caloramator sp. CAR-1]|uniref:hypothetical protein n=1 Tax=Caloramator sp. CAR-1 TaxID=3062777 RepID=UPI0026E170C3|nr:hypothetical protein [Caloramator sp. CAR-1]MDO6353973.1 hypothetical protein [Caloramator sp. CAR-1]
MHQNSLFKRLKELGVTYFDVNFEIFYNFPLCIPNREETSCCNGQADDLNLKQEDDTK